MVCGGRVLVVAAVSVLLASHGYAQAQEKPAAPASDKAATPAAPKPAALVSEAQGTANWGPVGPGVAPPPWAVPPQGPLPHEDDNGPLLKGDPLLDGPPYAPPGWFAAVEVDPVWSHVKNRLTAPVTAGPVTDNVHLPTGGLGVSVAPRIELGYRLDQGAGSLLASYRFVETTGSQDVSPLGPAGVTGSVRSRLDLNVLDLDYGSRAFSLGPGWDMKWLAGIRLASLYFDSQAAGGLLAERVTNHFGGAGPHLGFELWHCLNDTGLALFGRLDTELLAGRIRQSFVETLPAGSGETDQGQTQVVPVLAVQAGLGWTLPGSEHLRFAAGYRWERWWDIGLVGVPAGSAHAELTVQGLFLRGEWRY
jgi:hypothetical protein